MPNRIVAPTDSVVLERQLLLQLGERLKSLRKSRAVTATEMAKRVGMSRTTLRAVESGDPGTSIGTYMRVIAALDATVDLPTFVNNAVQSAQSGFAAKLVQLVSPIEKIQVSIDVSRHQVQDLQSLVLHEEAVRQVRANPELKAVAAGTLERWLQTGDSRSRTLWLEWKAILETNAWRRVTARTSRAQQLRQASPLVTVLPPDVRLSILAQVRQLKTGIALGDENQESGPFSEVETTGRPSSKRHGQRARQQGGPDQSFIALFHADSVCGLDTLDQGVHAAFVDEIASALGWSKKRLLSTVGLNPRTFNRMMKDSKPLAKGGGELLIGIAKLVGQVEAMLKESGNPTGFDAARWTARWLDEPLAALGGRKPLEFMKTIGGQSLVSNLLAQAQSGAYS